MSLLITEGEIPLFFNHHSYPNSSNMLSDISNDDLDCLDCSQTRIVAEL